MSETPHRTPADVLPPAASQLLGVSWVLLFAGRWIIVPLMLAAGIVSPSLVADVDDRILVRCYLALLAVSITVLILRAMRGARVQSAPTSPEPTDYAAAPPNREPSDAAGREPNTGD